MSISEWIETPDIVVVEDNDDDAAMTIMALKRISPVPKYYVVDDGEKALECLTGDGRVQPKVVLLDLKIPKVHGLDVLETLKSDPDCQHIPVVVLTSSDDPSDVNRANALGCEAYLCKPVDWEKYIKLVCSKAAELLDGCSCGESD